MENMKDNVGFYIIYGVAIAFMLYLIWSKYMICFTAKAGEADKYVFKIGVGKRLDKNRINAKTKLLQLLLVNGNSMADYGIFNMNSIWVQKFNEEEKRNITSFPVLVLSLVDPIKKSDSLYKLRKFVGYVKNGESIDWGAVYEEYKSRVKPSVSKGEFIASCEHSYSKSYERLKNDDIIVLSETFDEGIRKYHYSVHTVSQVYAKVKYAA